MKSIPRFAKTVRVFISSTFRDMHAERDHLVTIVFPELRERLERLNLELYDVDLRWGVPEKGPDGEIANSWAYCKRWIERVEPFFISLLGQRYGWVPPESEIRDDKDRETYKGMSITEMEIRYAVLSGDLNRRSFFYFRDTSVPEDTPRNIYREFVDPDEQERLRRFKEEDIAASQQPVRRYGCRWIGTAFDDLDSFGQMVLEDLWSGVLRDKRYVPKEAWEKVLGHDPERDPLYSDMSEIIPSKMWEQIVEEAKPTSLNPLDAASEQMAAFAAARLRWFHGHKQELNQLLAFVENDVPPQLSRVCVVSAVAGQGKSALLAKLAEQLENSSHLVITHFVGVSERGSDVRSLLERLDQELERKGIGAQKKQQHNYDMDSLRRRFAERLENYHEKRHLVLLIDAINQLGNGHDLFWLPRRLGSSVRIILSSIADPATSPESIEGRVLSALKARTPPLVWVNLQALSEEDVRQIVQEYLAEYCKELDAAQIETICNMKQAHNPLYLLVMLNELRTLGGNDMNRIVPKLIAEMKAKYPDTVNLFDWVLERLEIFGRDAVKLWCMYVASGREGMSSRELSDLLALKLGDGAARTAMLTERGLRQYLHKRGPQLDFFHDQLRQAVKSRYLKDDARLAHVDIAGYFGRRWKEPYIRALNELPYHFYHSAMFGHLQEYLTNLEYIHQRCKYGDIYALIEDYEKLPEAMQVQTEPCRRFLRTYSQSLMEYREFFSTYCYESAGEAREKLEALSLAWPWPHLRTDHLSIVDSSDGNGPDYAVRKELNFQFGKIVPAASLAPAARLAFYIRQLGEIRIVSLENTQERSEFIYIRRERPLQLASSADGRYLAVAYETGETDIINLSYDSNGNLKYFETVATISYLLPESEKPFIHFIDSKLYYQKSSGELISYDPATRQEFTILDHVVNGAELSCVLQLDGHLACMFRHKSDTLLMVVHVDDLRLQSSICFHDVDVSAACVKDSNSFYLAFTNFEIVGLRVNRDIDEIYRQVVKEVPEALICLQNSLLWVSNRNMYGQFTDQLERPFEIIVADQSLVGSITIEVWNDNELCIISRAAVSCFRISAGHEQVLSHISRIFETGKDHYVALGREKELLYLIDVDQQIRFPLWEDSDRDFIADTDGLNNLAVVGKSGAGKLCSLAERFVESLEGLPANLQCITGVPLGGFWMADDRARLYYLNRHGKVTSYWEVPGGNATSKWIHSDGKQLILCCSKLLVEYPVYQLLFMDIDFNVSGLRLSGRRTFEMQQFEINNLAWSPSREELFLIGRTEHGCMIKKGTTKQYMEELEENYRVQDIDLVLTHVAVDADDSALWLVSSKGNLFRVQTDLFKVEVVLSPTDPVTGLATRPMQPRSIACISNEERIFQCSFVSANGA